MWPKMKLVLLGLLFSVSISNSVHAEAQEDIYGHITTGTYAGGNCAATGGACFQGNVGIGTLTPGSPLSLVGLGTTAPIGTSSTGTLCIDSANNVYRKASCP